ncbi:kinetochore protein Mis12/MTW1 [Ceratobasidium sp. AG-Ba]|nr:kinetochore protein Mis12/MTW1 [Ceratobasidium sp. AG-Ba]
MLTELLGFVPQLLLDDIADAATDTVNNAIEGLEDYLRKWLSTREQQPPSEDLEAEIENGLLEFHTLLCGHRDMSIDMLETWSMRNVFYVPPELKIVMPHQKGLDLTILPGKDVQAQVELDVLRRKIENARKFQEQLKRADELTQQRLDRAQTRLDQLKFLRNLDPSQVESLPNQIRSIFASLRTLSTAVPPLPAAPAEGARLHTESRPEFLDWAIRRLVDPNTGSNPPSGDLSAALDGVRDDEEGEDERRLVGGQSTEVEDQVEGGAEDIPSSQNDQPPSSQTRPSRADLSIIEEAEDQAQDVTQRLSFAEPSSQPSSQTLLSSSQAPPPSSQEIPSSQGAPQPQPQNLSQTSTVISEASTSTITTIKRRRSSMIGPGMGAAGKRRRSSLGLAERARAGKPSANGNGTGDGATDE